MSETRTQVRPFAAILQDMGSLHTDASMAIADVAQAVEEYRKQGTITITLKLKPNGDNGVMVESTLKQKAPEGERPATMFFTDKEGNLLREDPRQQKLPLREATPMGELREAK